MIKTALFLFPHQDDEFGVFKQIQLELALGRRVVCAYLTTGVDEAGDPTERNDESLKILTKLGVLSEDIVFPGTEYLIHDKCLMYNLDKVASWFSSWFDEAGSPVKIYIPCWEGGHPDHDALHGTVVRIAARNDKLHVVRQFSLYNAYRCKRPFFRVLSPIKLNGPVEKVIITFGERFYYNYLAVTGYPSQRKSWIGLYPFFLMHHLFYGTQELQDVTVERTYDRPHEGNLYYENRGFAKFEDLILQLNNWERATTQ